MPALVFGDITLDPDTLEIRRQGELLDLEPKSFKVLAYLASHPGRVITKEELLESVWNATAVTDNSLTRVIAQLRKAIGDDARQARYIETVPTVGYKFIASVREAAVPPPPDSDATQAQPPRKINWWVPAGALSAIILAYLMPFLKIWTAGGPPVLKPVQFTTGGGLDSHPSFSPDSSSLVYSSDKNGHFEIYVKQVSPGGKELAITNDGKENIEPAWSPDGSLIAYSSYGSSGVFLVSALGGAPRRLTSFGSQPAWTADGRSIIFRSEGITSMAFPEGAPGTASSLWMVSLDGTPPRQLTKTDQPPGRHSDPHLSTNGRHLAFLSHQPFKSANLYELDLKSGESTRIGTGNQYPVDFVYSPDGATVFFLGISEQDNMGFYRLGRDPSTRLSNGDPQLLTRVDYVQLRGLALTARGNRLAYSATTMSSNLWQVDLDGNNRQLTNETTFRVTHPVFSRDGSRIAYLMRKRGEYADVWVSPVDASSSTQITNQPGRENVVAWQSGDTAIIYGAIRQGRPGLWQYSLTDGAETLFAGAPEFYGMVTLAPDGKQVAYTSRDPISQVWKADLASGRKSQLTNGPDPVGYPSWSPDAQQIAVEIRRGDDTHLAIVPASGGPHRQLTNRPGHAWPFGWSPDQKMIAVAALWDGVWNVYTVDIQSGAAHKLTDNKFFRSFVRYPAWSPKGSPIIYEHNESKGNLYLADMPR